MEVAARLRTVQDGLRAMGADLAGPWVHWHGQPLPPGESPLRRRVAHHQFRMMMQRSSSVLAAILVGIILWLSVLWMYCPWTAIVPWTIASLAGNLNLVLLTRWFARQNPPDDELPMWEARTGRSTSVMGGVWGTVAILVATHAPEGLPYTAMGLLLVITGSLSFFAAFRPGIALFAVPCVAFTSIALISMAEVASVAAGLGFLVSVGLLMRLTYMQNTLMTQAMVSAEERLTLLHELDAQRQEATQANEAKTRFLASVSHDLSQPMHSIALLAGALRRQSGQQGDVVGQIGASVQAMGDMLGALQEVSRLDDGKLPLQIAPVALAPLFRRLELQFAAQAQAKGVSLRIVPSSARVVSDERQLQRMLANLISNAIRYAPQGRVLVRCRVRGQEAWLQVWDSGVGISREHRDSVFEEFFQVERTPRQGSEGLGLGLGLAIVHRLAVRLKHRLQLRSRLRRGSVFSIVVPHDAVQLVETEGAERLSVLLAGQLVLLIDDDATVLKSMQVLLESFQCHVLVASSTQAALCVVEEQLRTPDLIISDYRLGEGDTGLEAIAQVRALIDEQVPALLVTAEIDKPIDAAQGLGVPVLPKPLQLDLLSSHLGQLLRSGV